MQRSFLTTNHPYRETYGRFAWIRLEGAMKTRRFLVVAILLFASSAPVWADDHAASVESQKRLAAQGNVEAQVKLGVMYATGQGIPRDDAEALKWFRLAATQGNAEAQVYLGFMYATEGAWRRGARARAQVPRSAARRVPVSGWLA